jgi:(p)ppGpp synthase/HD superfamily hydrolase
MIKSFKNREFGSTIADIVLELTSSEDEIENEYNGDKVEYLVDKLLNMTDDALIVKLADFEKFMNIVRLSAKAGNKNFTYTLIESKDIV